MISFILSFTSLQTKWEFPQQRTSDLPRDTYHKLASPPGHSPKAERWPGTDCLRMLQNYTKTGVISKTPCTFREFVRARLDIRPFQFTSTMTSATVTATDTFNDAVKAGKAGMVLLVRNITATQAVLSGTT